MVHPLPLDDAEDVQITTAETKALARLAVSKDWEVLLAVMSRWHTAQAIGLVKVPRDAQDFELIKQQGALAAFRKMVQFVETGQ